MFPRLLHRDLAHSGEANTYIFRYDPATPIRPRDADPSVASATCGFRWIPGVPDVVRDTLFSRYHTGVLGTGSRRRQPWLPPS
jgi:hypothetical protein